MFQTIIVVFIAFILAYILALAVLRNKNRKLSQSVKSSKLDKIFIQKKWLEIEQVSNLGSPSNFKSSILEADKLVDYTLKALGAKGETFGERLKNSKSVFHDYSDYNNLWFAHKVRNNVAHETTYDLNSAEAKRAIEYFKKALRELGAL